MGKRFDAFSAASSIADADLVLIETDVANADTTQRFNKKSTVTLLKSTILANPTFTGAVDGGAITLHDFKGKINAQTGTTYETVADDNGQIITLSNGSAITLTVHAAAPAGWNCLLIQLGAGQVTIAASGGNVRNRSSHTKIAGQYGMVSCFVVSNAGTAPELYIAGDTAA